MGPGAGEVITASEKFWLRTGCCFETELLVTKLCRYAALRRAFEVAFHDEIRLINLLQGVGFLTHGHGEGIHTHRPAAEFYDDSFEDALDLSAPKKPPLRLGSFDRDDFP